MHPGHLIQDDFKICRTSFQGGSGGRILFSRCKITPPNYLYAVNLGWGMSWGGGGILFYTLDPHMSGKPVSPCGIALNLLTNYVMVPELSFYFSCAISGGGCRGGYCPTVWIRTCQVSSPQSEPSLLRP